MGRQKALPPFIRNCPKCDKQLEYTNVKHRNRAEKLGKSCQNCSAKKSWEINTESKIIRLSNRRNYAGKNNPFYGKCHSADSKKKMAVNKDLSIYKTSDFSERMSKLTIGQNNAMYGKTYYDKWIIKYGKEEADKKLLAHKEKLSKLFSGENNPMYGKPAPKGSGGGWSGWYKGWFFRSLRELAYMIKVIEPCGYSWKQVKNFL